MEGTRGVGRGLLEGSTAMGEGKSKKQERDRGGGRSFL